MNAPLDPDACRRAVEAADRQAPALLTILEIGNLTEIEDAFERIGDLAARLLSDLLWARVDRDA